MTSIKVKPAWPPPALRQIPNPKFLFLPAASCPLPAFLSGCPLQKLKTFHDSRSISAGTVTGPTISKSAIRNSKFLFLPAARCLLLAILYELLALPV
jgi:hypothetical protein